MGRVDGLIGHGTSSELQVERSPQRHDALQRKRRAPNALKSASSFGGCLLRVPAFLSAKRKLKTTATTHNKPSHR